MVAQVAKYHKIVPTSILGVIIGTHCINPHEEEEGEHTEYGFYGYLPNEMGERLFAKEAVDLLKKCNEKLSSRFNWSLKVNHESGGVSIVVDPEEDEIEETLEQGYSTPDVNWVLLFGVQNA